MINREYFSIYEISEASLLDFFLEILEARKVTSLGQEEMENPSSFTYQLVHLAWMLHSGKLRLDSSNTIWEVRPNTGEELPFGGYQKLIKETAYPSLFELIWHLKLCWFDTSLMFGFSFDLDASWYHKRLFPFGSVYQHTRDRTLISKEKDEYWLIRHHASGYMNKKVSYIQDDKVQYFHPKSKELRALRKGKPVRRRKTCRPDDLEDYDLFSTAFKRLKMN
ncbi:hypothetical protein IFO69_15080 [Echinicola sp. CAU 1574]|uniref:Uncharacterized protein n=1 Tax=Echinicola arenosa TaxID=2774144 RepID=A0ABR9AMP6_9BACT|nr:hypothetical protein [Echinicola arenosa]MBD8490079.1 hypothetical protein [Echinicola arenosa]